jgi:hypothetical protein
MTVAPAAAPSVARGRRSWVGPRGSEKRGWRWAGWVIGEGPVGREAGG